MNTDDMVPVGYFGMWNIPPTLGRWVALAILRAVEEWAVEGAPEPPAELMTLARSMQARSGAEAMADDLNELDSTDDVYLSTAQAAELVGYHPQQIRRWHKAGKVRGMKQGNRLLVSSSDVELVAKLHRVGDWPDDW